MRRKTPTLTDLMNDEETERRARMHLLIQKRDVALEKLRKTRKLTIARIEEDFDYATGSVLIDYKTAKKSSDRKSKNKTDALQKRYNKDGSLKTSNDVIPSRPWAWEQ